MLRAKRVRFYFSRLNHSIFILVYLIPILVCCILIVKFAYHNLCLKLHPDRTQSDNREKFQKVQKAYEVLMNPAKREKYDADGTIDEKYVIYIATNEIVNRCRQEYACKYS